MKYFVNMLYDKDGKESLVRVLTLTTYIIIVISWFIIMYHYPNIQNDVPPSMTTVLMTFLFYEVLKKGKDVIIDFKRNTKKGDSNDNNK